MVAVEDTNGNLTHSTDQRTGTTHFEYDKLGRITKAGSELFVFDLRTVSFQKNLKDKTGFVRDGSHLLQEIHSDGRYTYLNSYEPLAQVRDGQPTKEKADTKSTTSTRPYRLPKR
nr:RHS repeat protein [Rothia sp. RSM482]